MRLRRLSLALLLSCAPLLAQSFTPVREQKNLSPAAVAKLHALETLNSLPAGDWRFHVGDIPHGESPTLDDSSWTLVQPKSKAPHEAVWYRREIEVPKTLNGYDITGSRISFQFRSDANGAVPEIIYFNGKRVALGEDLEPIVLFEPAHPGDKILVAVKLLQTVDDKTFSGVRLTIEPNPNATGATARPSPDDIRIQCIAAATLLPALPTPRPDLLPKVEEAVAAIDTNALASADQAAFDKSLRHAQEILTTLHPVLAEAKIDLAGNSHIDAAWLWPRSETIDVVKRTFTTALQLMNEYPDYTFSQSAAQYTEWMAEKYPALNDQIRQRVKEGRWEIVGGMWVEPDLNLPDGESQVRQLLLGQRYFQQQYGVVARIGWNPDSFGYNWQTPQIYKRSGLDYFVTQKMHWNDTNQLPFRLFWWESPDGSKVLTYFPTDYVHDNVNPTRISADFAESADRNPGTTELLDLYGIGDHGGGPTRAMLDQADHWIAAGSKDHVAVPTMRYHTAQNYFTNVEKNLNPTSPTWDYDNIAKGYTAPPAANGALGIPTWKDELYFEYHRGVYTTQAAHKRNMRTSEVATLDAEKLASFAWLDGQPYPNAELTESWKKITFNGFHDLAAGSGIAVIYKDAQRDYTEVFNADKLITDASLKTLADQIDTTGKSGIPVLVTNPMAWQRSDTVFLSVQLPDSSDGIQIHDSRNKPVLAQVVSHDAATHRFDILARVDNIPALGYTVLHVEKSAPDTHPYSALHVDEGPNSVTLGNAHIEAVIDRKSGCITSLKSKTLIFDLVHEQEALAPNGCGNQLQTFKDTPKQYDAWNIDPGTLDGTMTPIANVDSIAITDNGPLRKTIRITRTWQSSKFVQDISLDAGADTVRISNDIDWHETHVLLKAAFPLAATSGKATYEIPYGSIERPTTRNNSWEKAQFEVPAMRWADLGDDKQGLSILNDSKYGYDAVGNTLRITLLRSPTWPDAEADRGHQHFVYALYPHAGSWKQAQTVRRGYELNDPLKATQVFAHTGTLPAEHSFASIENPNVTLTAIKKAEDSDALVFRMYEWAGTASEVKLHIPPGATYAIESNMMEKPEGDHLSLTNDVVTIPIKPYEILTLQAIYPPPTAATINK
ncbi:alpha-mannosidase [Tunturiibacter gelidoferens]|uniref:Alpha-mannosidase n=1 Tax=Tunturiibacter gelidiferens TaxID=3069689 RepID=A0ACC5NTT6_9BACT|nr:glycoside hydrolase family 38 C-terminal domain-containing protein [Edaphobacter lichenicola]MBB5337962.1 alpha-mannosidase [Edaphobacter lichenicola]